MKVLLIGYYGYGNIGDEALLEAMINSLNKYGEFDFSVLSYNVEKTEAEHAVKGISRGKHRALIREIRSVDAVVVGGGSVLQDVTSSLSLFYYLAILLLAKLFGKKAFLVGNGYGPIKKPFNQFVLRCFLPLFDGVIARDEESFKAFKDLKVKKAFCGVDLVYLLDNSLYKRVESVKKNVVISLRPWHNSDNTKKVISKTIAYLQDLGYQVKLLSMKQPEDDRELAAFICEEVALISHDLKGTINALSEADFVIGMRLHALILSANVNTPFIAISYDPKVDSFNRQIYHQEAINTENMSFDELKSKIDAMIQNLNIEEQLLLKSTENNRNLAEQQMKTFMKWLEE